MVALQRFLKQKIISSNQDKVSLVFYNTKTTNNNLNFKGVSVVFYLEEPSAKVIKEVATIGIII